MRGGGHRDEEPLPLHVQRRSVGNGLEVSVAEDPGWGEGAAAGGWRAHDEVVVVLARFILGGADENQPCVFGVLDYALHPADDPNLPQRGHKSVADLAAVGDGDPYETSTSAVPLVGQDPKGAVLHEAEIADGHEGLMANTDVAELASRRTNRHQL